MHALARLDYAIIIGYLALSLVMGFAMTRKASSSLDNYFLGGRNLPWYLLGVAGMANWFDLTGTMLITSFLYMLGPRGLFIEFRGGAVLILAFMLVYTGKWHRRSGCMTGAEWNIYRFGESRVSEAVRILGAFVSVVTAVMLLAYLIRGATLFLGMFFPFPATTTTLVLVTVTTLYTMSSGFFGVVMTDLVQGVVVIASCIIIAFMAWHLVPTNADLAMVASQVTGNPDWVHSRPAWRTPMPPGYEDFSPLILLASFYFLRHFLGGMGTGGEARYFGARSDRDCGLQSLQQAVMTMFRWPLMIGFAVMGIYFVHAQYPDPGVMQDAASAIHTVFPDVEPAHWHDLTSDIVNNPGNYPPELIAHLHQLFGDVWQYKLPLIGIKGTVNPEQILPAVLLNMVPTGLKGLIVVAMFAAMMSCKNGLVNGSSAFFVKDIYQNLIRPNAGNRELIYASYGSTLGIVILGYIFGVAAPSINKIWDWIIMGLMAGQLAPGMLRLYWWRCNAWGCVGGTVLGGLGAIIQRIFWPDMTGPWQFALMTTLSFAGTIGGSLLTAPTPMATLRHFYRTTRPFGLWGPLLGEFQGDDRRRVDEENRSDMMALPFALLWQVTLFLLPMQLVIKSYTSALWTLPLFLTGACGMWWYWWRPLMRHTGTPLDTARSEEPGTGGPHGG